MGRGSTKVKAMRRIAAPHGEVFLGHVPTGDGVGLGSLGGYSSKLRCLRHHPTDTSLDPQGLGWAGQGRTRSSSWSIAVSIAGGSLQLELAHGHAGIKDRRSLLAGQST